MRNTCLGIGLVLIASLFILAGCGKVQAQADVAAAGAPPEPKVVQAVDLTLFSVDHPEQFPFVEATEHPSTSELTVTGTVNSGCIPQRPRGLASFGARDGCQDAAGRHRPEGSVTDDGSKRRCLRRIFDVQNGCRGRGSGPNST